MTIAEPGSEWKAFHLFCHSPVLQERLLAEELFPLVKTLQEKRFIEAWFFIRYWEGGPHIRLRFKRPVDPETAERLLRERVGRFIESSGPVEKLTKETYYKGHKFDGEAIDQKDLPWYEHGEIAVIAYEPEVVRYGGKGAIGRSERLFHASSEMVVRLMEVSAGNFGKRLILAFDTMLVTALGFGVEPQETKAFFRRYAEYWRRFVDSDDVAAQARGNAIRQADILIPRYRELTGTAVECSGIGLYREWTKEASLARQGLAKLYAEGGMISPVSGLPVENRSEFIRSLLLIASSHMHMTNNRLGVVPPYEHALGVMLYTVAEMAEAAEGGGRAWNS
ncbi:thiopeptide-type bacteriocin biosynthesis protein [Paenibacillus tarimensis]